MITQCPVCGTLFRVVPDQLRISDGWVRCGQCSEVFDASTHLQEPPLEAPTPGGAPTDPPPVPFPGAPASAPTRPAASPPTFVPPEPDEARVTAQAPGPAPLSGSRDTGVDLLLDDLRRALPPGAAAPAEPLAAPPAPVLPAQSGPDTRPASVSQTALAPLAPVAPPAPAEHLPKRKSEPAWYAEFKQSIGEDPDVDPGSEAAGEEATDPLDLPMDNMGFVRQARRRAWWQRPAVRMLLSAVAVVLLLVLAAQVAVHNRDRLAALQPAAKPLLEFLCRPTGCLVQAPRQLDAIVIDSSTFNRLAPDTYRLAVTVRNQSSTEVATPWLELTLTDAGEQPVLRRVISPTELGVPSPAVITGGGEWSPLFNLSVSGDAAAAGRVAGYRLVAFYP